MQPPTTNATLQGHFYEHHDWQQRILHYIGLSNSSCYWRPIPEIIRVLQGTAWSGSQKHEPKIEAASTNVPRNQQQLADCIMDASSEDEEQDAVYSSSVIDVELAQGIDDDTDAEIKRAIKEFLED